MPRILIIEDDEKLREELKIFLNKNGYEATTLTTFDNTINDYIKNKSRFNLIRYKFAKHRRRIYL